MSTITSELIDPSTLDHAAKQALLDELYATHTQIFDGVSKQQFAAYVVDSPAERTRIEVYRDAGRMVGYIALHTFVRELAGERWVVLRGETGKLPAYRRNASGSLFIAEMLRICLRYPGARKALLGCFVHPSSYVALGHCATEIYPHWERSTPPDVAAAMDMLAQDFHLEPIDDDARAHDGVRKVGWITRESEADRRSWAQRDCEMSRYFRAHNPGYVEGHGLVVLMPISFGRLLTGCVHHLRRSLARRPALTSPARGRAAQLA